MNVRSTIADALEDVLRALEFDADVGAIVLERPKDPAHGDMSSPIAMGLARALRRNPVEIAEAIVSRLTLPGDVVAGVDVLKPGFINFRFAPAALTANVTDVIAAGERYGAVDAREGKAQRVQVEYVSANPTGPLVVVSARAAAVGSALVNVLRFGGFIAEGEYYVNDFGKQIDALGESLRFRLKERLGSVGSDEAIGAYPGTYVKDIAAGVADDEATRWLQTGTRAADLGAYAAGQLLDSIRTDLEAYGVHFDSFFRESTLHPEAIAAMFEQFSKKGFTYEEDGAVYFRSSEFGDEKDRVIRKRNGETTYFLADIAYHNTKIERGFGRVIALLGPDHHGHVPRMKAAMNVLGASDDWLDVLLVGWVRLLEDGKPVSMSKRAGEFVSMSDLIRDVGVDVAKYFFLMRRANSPLDFDLTLARKQSDENPVYYVQYAHARISSVLRFAEEKGQVLKGAADVSLLVEPAERALMVDLLYFSNVVAGAAQSCEPHRLTTYAQELATAFHRFYHECRIVDEDAALSAARLDLARATMQVLCNALTLLGVSAPRSM